MSALQVNVVQKSESAMNNDWHKALVLVMRKLGVVEILITQDDMDNVSNIQDESKHPAALVFQQEDGVHIKLVTAAEARELEELGYTKSS